MPSVLCWPESSPLTCKVEHRLGKLRAEKSGVGVPADTRGFSLFQLSRPALEPPHPAPARFVPGFFPEGQVAGEWMLPLPLVPRLRISGAVSPLRFPVAAQSETWLCSRSSAGIFGSNPAEDMDVCCECCVLSGRRLCLGLITRKEESYWVWCVKRRPWPTRGCSAVIQLFLRHALLMWTEANLPVPIHRLRVFENKAVRKIFNVSPCIFQFNNR